MARIPTVQDLGSAPVPVSRRGVTADPSGQIVGEALQGAASNLAQISERGYQRQNRVAYAKAKSQFLRSDIEARRELEQDDDWETYEQRYRERMREGLDNTLGELSREDQALFEAEAQVQIERGADTIRSLSQEREASQGMADLMSILDENRAAALNAEDEPTRSAIIDNTLDMIAAARERDWLPPEQAQQMRQRWTTDFAEGAVSMMPAAERAEVLANAKGTVADYIQPDRRKALLEQAKAEDRALVVRATSQQEADRIMASFDNEGEALKAAREHDDPEIRDALVNRVKARFGEQQAIETADRQRVMTEASTLVEESGSTTDIPRRDWLKLDISQRRALEVRAQQVSAGVEPTTDWSLYYDMVDQAVTEPEKFADEHLMFYRHKLKDSEFKELVHMQMGLRGQDESGLKLLSGVRTNHQIVSGALDEMGIAYGTSASAAQNERANEFRRHVDQRVIDFQRQTGREATSEDVQRIVDELIVQGREGTPTWFGREPTVRRFEADDEFVVTDVEQIPDLDREVMEEQLRAMGREVTDESLLSLYNAGL